MAMSRRGVDTSRASLQGDIVSQDQERITPIQRMPTAMVFHESRREGCHDFEVTNPDFFKNFFIQSFSKDEVFLAGIDDNVWQFRVQTNRQVGRDRPRRGCPDDKRQGFVLKADQLFRQFVVEGKLHINGRRTMIVVFNLCFGQGGHARGAPMDWFPAFIKTAALGKACEFPCGGRLVVGRHGQVRISPIPKNPQAAELFTLDVDPFMGVVSALLTDLGLAHVALGLSQFLVDLQFDWQTMAVPPGNIRCEKTLHPFALDNDIFQNLI